MGFEFNADGRAGMTKLIDPFRNFSNAPKNYKLLQASHSKQHQFCNCHEGRNVDPVNAVSNILVYSAGISYSAQGVVYACVAFVFLRCI